jgi:hypothetical protein
MYGQKQRAQTPPKSSSCPILQGTATAIQLSKHLPPFKIVSFCAKLLKLFELLKF